MDDMKFAIERLIELNMHVKLISEAESDIDFKYPLTPYDTHYIMRGPEIVHVGNVKTVYSFALSKHT